MNWKLGYAGACKGNCQYPGPRFLVCNDGIGCLR